VTRSAKTQDAGRTGGVAETEEGMPAKSKKQQMAAGAALAAKRGEKPKSSLRGASKQMAQSTSEGDLHNSAHARRCLLRATPARLPSVR
jgi:hypothetical protein